jgi:drug/metabolite transporter (DMT)-like permease
MLRLTSVLFSIVAPTLGGIGVIVALTTGNDTLQPILIGAALGAALAVPVSWVIAKKLSAPK